MNDLHSQDLQAGLSRLTVRAWRMHLEPQDLPVTVPMLRGVWGAALHDLDGLLYDILFEGRPLGAPGYLLRPAGNPASDGVCFDFLLFGPLDGRGVSRVWAAWDLALQRGLGRFRQPGRLRNLQPLAWDGSPLATSRHHPGFPLHPLAWPTRLDRPSRLVFPTPVRLLREEVLVTSPTLADLTIATLRRFKAQAPEAARAAFESRHRWLELARDVPALPFVGRPCDLVRYSGRQQCEIELRGMVGELTLPQGPGPLADLLLAATWLHVGKSTVQGLGMLSIVGEPPML
ncbi:MAG: CRISPR system precrRNA processing endoribonuclease RAMP protein Cas6 [Gemmataceae bacterium]